MNGRGQWLVNGKAGDSVSVRDRGLTYADGLFETVAVRDGRPRFLDYHLERLADSCRRLGMSYPAAIADEAQSLARDCEFGTAKIIVTRGAGERGYAPPDNPGSTRIVGVMPGDPPARGLNKTGVAVRFCDTRIGTNSSLAGMKTLARLEQVMARSELRGTQADEGLMSSDDGRVICGTMTNLFFVDGGNLRTPDLSRCGIGGVMRRVVIEQARKCDIEHAEVDIDAGQLQHMTEIFLSNSLIGIWPVRQLGEAFLDVGATTRRLMAELVKIGVTECDV